MPVKPEAEELIRSAKADPQLHGLYALAEEEADCYGKEAARPLIRVPICSTSGAFFTRLASASRAPTSIPVASLICSKIEITRSSNRS
jgi:hypothetical protein